MLCFLAEPQEGSETLKKSVKPEDWGHLLPLDVPQRRQGPTEELALVCPD